MNDELAIIGGFKTELRGLIDVKVSQFYSSKIVAPDEYFCVFLGERTNENLLVDVSRCSNYKLQG